MKIRAIIGEENASSWWRIIRPLTMLRSQNVDATYHKMESAHSIDVKGSLVIIHSIIPSDPKQYIDDLYRRGAKRILYSMDDYNCNAQALREYLTLSGGLTQVAIDRIIARIPNQLETMRLCDAVLVSSYGLGELVFDDIHNSVIVLSNALDERWFIDHLSVPEEEKELITIGYASGRRPKEDLESMALAWGKIAEKYENVEFVVAGYQHDIIDENIPLERKRRIPFRALEEWPMSMQVDIGCCPLADTLYNRGKSVIKFYEYTLAGATVVASSLLYSNHIFGGVSGYIAETEQEWFKYLDILVKDEKIRNTMRDCALYEVHNYRTLEATIHNWFMQFERILS